MLREALLLLTAGAALAQTAAAQAVRSRSADYLFAASATDARALWVNPAGLAASLEASVMAEIAVERPVDGGLRWAQWAAALNSRGFSLGYQRDRFEDGPSTGTLRFGLALPFPRGAVGAAFSFYSGNAIDTTNNTVQGLDFGARYRLLLPLEVGAVVRNIGRPALRDSVAPLVGTLSLTLQPFADHLVLAGEVTASERFNTSGYDLSYRAGLQISTGGSLPFTLISSLDLQDNLHPRYWLVGLAVGGQDRGIALGSGGWDAPRDRLERISLTGVASRQLGGAR